MSEASPHVDASEAGQKCADLLNNSLLSSLFTSVPSEEEGVQQA